MSIFQCPFESSSLTGILSLSLSLSVSLQTSELMEKSAESFCPRVKFLCPFHVCVCAFLSLSAVSVRARLYVRICMLHVNMRVERRGARVR